MAGGDLQYLLRLGVDTGIARPEVDALNQSLTRVGRTADRVLSGSERATQATDRFTTSTAGVTRATTDATRTTDRFTGSQRGLESSLSRTTKRLLGYAAAFVGIRQAVRLAQGAVGNFSDVEGGLIGVRKTTDLVTDELTKLHKEVLDLATGPVPLATTELLELAQVSGQLGVRGREDLTAYVETLGQLSAATDVVGAQGAKDLTRLLNVQGEANSMIREVGAALTALGNDAAATEAEILSLATEVGLGTAQFQIGSVNALGFATAMAEMGIRVEMGGTAIGRTMREIQSAVASGGEDLQAFADVAQVSGEDFAAAFRRDPVEAFLLLFQGLSTLGQDSAIALDQLGLGSDRLAKVLPVLAQQYGILEGRIKQANAEAELGTALEIEAGRAFDQTSADLSRLREAYRATSAEVGRGMSPAVRELALEMRDYLTLNREAATALGEDLGNAVKVAGEIVLFLARNIDLLQAAVKALIILKLSQWLSQGVAWLQAYAASTTRATAAQVGLNAATAASIPIYGAQGQVLSRVAVGTNEVAKTSTLLKTRFGDLTTGGIRPLTVGLGAVLGVVLLLNEAVKTWGDSMDREIRRILELSNQFGERTKGVQDEARRLLDAARFQREFEQELLREGIADPTSEEALRVRERMEADLHRTRVDSLLEWRSRLRDVTDEMDRVGERMREIRDVSIPAQEARRAGAMTMEDPEFTGAQAEIDRLNAELSRAQVEFRDLNTERIILQRELPRLDDATQDYVATVADLGDVLPPVTEEQKKARVEFQQTLSEILAQARGMEVLAAAYADGPEAVRDATDALELENRLRSLGIDLTTEQAKALGFEAQLRRALVTELEAEQRLTGAETIDGLTQQVEAQARVNAAYSEGAEAVALARREQELAEEQSGATAGAHKDQVSAIENLVRQFFDLAAAQESLRAEQELRQQRDDLLDLVAAYDQGRGAVEATRAALGAENEIRRQTIDLVGEERDRRMELAVEVERLFARSQAKDVVKALEDQLDAAKDLQEIRRGDFFTERQYQEALRQVNFERELEVQLIGIRAAQAAELAAIRADETVGVIEQAFAIAKVNEEYEDLIGQAKKAAQETRNIEIGAGLDTSTTQLDAWIDAGRSIADALREVDEGLADIADSAVDVLVAFEDIGTAAGRVDFAVAAGDLVASIGQQLTGPNNYAAEGGLIGAIAGAIIGAYFGGATGAQAGAAIGGSAGSALGSFVKKGADEFLAEFELSAQGGLEGTATKVEGKMASIGRRYIDAIERGIEEALDQLGAFLVGIPDIGIKVREGVFGITVGAVKAHFESLDEAVDFAILEVLKQGDVIGLSDEVRTALQNSTAETFQALSEDLDFAKWVERLPEIGDLASQAGTALFDAVDQFQAALRKADELGLDSAKIEQWFAHTLEAVRNNVLGIVETEEERIRREAEGFNLARQLIEAEQHMRRADLLLKQQELQAEAEILAAKEGLTVAELQIEAAKLDASARFASAHLQIAKATAEAAAAIFNALAAVELALTTVDTILAGLPALISEEEIAAAIGRVNRGGGEQRRREREDARREIEDLRLLASGMGETALDLRRELEDFDEWVAAARKLGIAEADLAQARLDNLALLEAELLAPFEDVLAGDDPAGLGDLLNRYVEALEQAAVLASARADAAGTTVGEEFARLAGVIAEAFHVELSEALTGSLPGLIAGGDLGGLEDLRASLVDLLASLPPSLAGNVSRLAEAIGLVDHALATMEALGLGGPVAGVDTSSIQEWLDLARGVSVVDQEIRDLQRSFLAVVTEARLAGASEEELALIHDGYREALDTLRDSVLDSVREYLDAAQGIGEFERKLLDLQQTFRDARAGLDAIAGGVADEGTLFAEPESVAVLVEKGVRPALDHLVDAAEETFREVADVLGEVFGVEIPVPGSGVPDGSTGERPRGPFAKSRTAGISPAEDVQGAMDDAGDAASDLASDLRDLEDAERRAIQALGVEFIGSLEDLGVALPVELTLELAHAQFALAQAEAISSALALAAAGAFQGLSISIGDLLDLIVGASFDASAFAPRQTGGGVSRGGGQDAVDNLLSRVEEQLRAWDQAGLGDAATSAIALAESLVQVRADAEAAGVSLDRVSESYRRAVASFVDDALAEFEDLDLSPLEAELQGIQDQFVDLLVGFDVIGASAEDMLRLEEAFILAMEDFLERATSGIRAFAEELRASDPRRSPEQRFVESQSEFQEILARAQSGDLDAIQELEAAARDYRQEAVDFLGFGVGSQEVLDLILAGLDSIDDVEIVPEDIALLREQAERLLALIEIGEAQPTRDSNTGGLQGVQDAVDQDRETSGDLLDLILSALEDGTLNVPGIGDVLQTLADMVGLIDLSTDDLQRILDAVSGTIDVADTLSPQQLDSLVNLVGSLGQVKNLTDAQSGQLSSMIQQLLGLSGLTDAQRNILLGIDAEADSQGGTLNSILTKVADSAQKLTSQNAFTEPLLRSINVRAGEQRVLLGDIKSILSGMQSFDTGGYMAQDGLAFLHAGELVLNPQQTTELRRARSERLTSYRYERPGQSFLQPEVRSTEGDHGAAIHRAVVGLQQAIERGDTRRSQGEMTAAKLAEARLRQGGGELEVLGAIAAEVETLRREAARKARGLAGR